MVPAGVCQVFGNGVETGHHAVIGCTKAAALWEEMRKVWLLPDREQLQDFGPDWLLLLLSRLDWVQRARAMLSMWRAWFLRNDAIFGTGRETITGSVNFLVSYHATLSGLCTKGSKETDVKGKATIDSPTREDRA
jgi:hypothetical protein